jgi:hypothetical protein
MGTHTRDGQLQAQRFTEILAKLKRLSRGSAATNRLGICNDDLHMVTCELLAEVGNAVDLQAIARRMEARDFPELGGLRGAIAAAATDFEGKRFAIHDQDPARIVRDIRRQIEALDTVREDQSAYVDFQQSLAIDIEDRIQSLLEWFVRATVVPHHLRRYVLGTIESNHRAIEFLHRAVWNEIRILGQLRQAPVPPVQSTCRDRAAVARAVAEYMTWPRPERLARIRDVDPTPDGYRLPGLAIMLSWRDQRVAGDPTIPDQVLSVTLHKVSTMAARLFAMKSSEIHGYLRVPTLRWAFFAERFVDRRVSTERLMHALYDLARDARVRVRYPLLS